MIDITQPTLTDDFCTITVHFTGTGVAVDQYFPYHLPEHLRTIALGTVIRKLMELYNDRLSARNTP